MAPKESVTDDDKKKTGRFFKMFKVCCTGKESSKPGLLVRAVILPAVTYVRFCIVLSDPIAPPCHFHSS
jgi:hypothetical protein